MPSTAWHDTAVSDVQLVFSPAVDPTRTATLSSESPIPLPCTVSTDEPVVARFVPPNTLIPIRFEENPPLVLPTCLPTLATIRTLPRTPCPPMHRNDVSDSQLVRSHPVCPVRDPALYPTSPTPRPDKVTLDEPVAAELPTVITLTSVPSPENWPVALPADCPTLNDALRLPIAPWLSRHRADVSDAQLVCSQELPPCLPAPDIHTTPIPAPCIVTLSAPLEAPLLRHAPLNDLPSPEKASLTLPTRKFTLTVAIRLPALPCPTLHRTLVSDIHTVSSHDVCPTRPPIPVVPASPSPAPDIVTLADPVPPRFDCPTTLILPRSTDCDNVVLPTLCPTLIATRPLPLVTSPTKLTTQVSDTHLVTSAAVPDPRIAAVYIARPIPIPNTVTSCDPVPAALDGTSPLRAGRSCDKPSLTLPNSNPAETETRRLDTPPSPPWHRTDVSDSHALRSQDVPCVRACPHTSACPSDAPNTVTLADPVEARFLTFTTLAAPPLKEYPAVVLPCRAPPLTTSRALLPIPYPAPHRTDVSDAHVVPSHPLPPCFIPPDSSEPPIPDPYNVTLADPELPIFARLAKLTDGRSPDTARDTLRPTIPTLSVRRRLPIKPCPETTDTTDVSDTQLVPSHPVPPVLPCPQCAASPIPAPLTVTLDEPVAALFTATTVLSPETPAENPLEPLPTRIPTLSDTLPLRRTPPVAKPRTALSDAHALLSDPLPPGLDAPVIPDPLYPAPYTVTDSDPVLALFARPKLLADPATNEWPSDALPARPPVLRCTRRLPPTPAPTSPRTELSDSHVVPSHAVLPTRPPKVLDHAPKLAPAIVTLLDPVPAALARTAVLTQLDSTEYTPLALPARLPTLATIRRLPSPTPPDPRLRTDVSDSQVDRSEAVDPCLTDPLYDEPASPLPCTDRLADPVAAPFARRTALNAQRPAENPSLALDTRPPTLIVVLTLPDTPCPALHRVDVSDAHTVPSHPDGPTRIHPLYPAAPTLAPCIVTRADPVAPPFVCLNELTETAATEKPRVKLPPRPPTVTSPRQLPICPPPPRHTTELSDTHTVPSHAVPPPRPAPDCAP
jgi:hypothetical protein